MHGVQLCTLLLSHMTRPLPWGAQQREQTPTAGRLDTMRIRECAAPLQSVTTDQETSVWLTVEVRCWLSLCPSSCATV